MQTDIYFGKCDIKEAGRHTQCEGRGTIRAFEFERGVRVMINEGTDRYARFAPDDVRLSLDRIDEPASKQTVVVIQSRRTHWVLEMPSAEEASRCVNVMRAALKNDRWSL